MSILKKVLELSELRNVFWTYLLTQGIELPSSSLFQVNLDTFLKLLFDPCDAVGNILIIQGGTRHMNKDSYYIKTASLFLSRKIRLFIFEKYAPVINHRYAHDVSDCIKYIKEKYEGPVVVIGYSMGGMLLLSYLAHGFDDADMYIPTCCSFDFHGFRSRIENNTLFALLQAKDYEAFGVANYEELLELADTQCAEQHIFMDQAITKFNQHSKNWAHKTIYVVAENDPLTKDHEDTISLLQDPPLRYVVKQGWHCCLSSVHLTAILAYNYCVAAQTPLTTSEVCPSSATELSRKAVVEARKQIRMEDVSVAETVKIFGYNM